MTKTEAKENLIKAEKRMTEMSIQCENSIDADAYEHNVLEREEAYADLQVALENYNNCN